MAGAHRQISLGVVDEASSSSQISSNGYFNVVSEGQQNDLQLFEAGRSRFEPESLESLQPAGSTPISGKNTSHCHFRHPRFYEQPEGIPMDMRMSQMNKP